MNDRIRELMRQATYDVLGVEQIDQQLFAELLITECADIALREEHDPYECIMKHFGIETADARLRNRSTYFGNNS